MYHRVRGKGDFSLFGPFSSFALLCEDAKSRQIVIPAFAGLLCLFAVVITGIAFVTEGGECIAMSAGT